MARFMKTIIGGLTAPLKLVGQESQDSEKLTETNEALNSSEEDEEDSFETNSTYSHHSPPSRRGVLSKWTNYLHGWQDRFFNVSDGIMAYFKSEMDTNYGCRGSVSLQKATVTCHEFDELRFDVRVLDCTYFLRAGSVEEKRTWIEVIEANKRFLQEMGTYESSAIRRQGSILSISSMHSTASFTSNKKVDLQEKMSELETFRNVLCRQLDTLQHYFDHCAQAQEIKTSTESIRDEEEEGETRRKSDENRESVDSGLDFNNTHLENNVENQPRMWVGAGDQTPPRGHTLPASHRQSPVIPRHEGHKRTGSDPFAFRNFGQPKSHYHRPSYSGYSSVPMSPPPVDFKTEAATFKATTIGFLTAIQQVTDLVLKREEGWQKKYEKELEHRRKAERAAHAAMNGTKAYALEYAGPDYEEGPHSVLNDDEFFDALEHLYQNEEESPKLNEKDVKKVEGVDGLESSTSKDNEEDLTILPKSITGVKHRMTEQVEEKVTQYAKYIFEPVDTTWALAHEDGDMKVYRRELEENGIVVDPLRAQFTVKGVTAKEVIDFFFSENTRLEWEGTLESVQQVEQLAEDTIIFHQMHKRVWPSTQRETLFCSHLCTLPNAPRPENMVGRTWMVCNFSIEHGKVPISSKLIRATLQVGMVCQTLTEEPVEEGKEGELTRDNVSCKMMYAANVNPGGWAPPAVVRAIAKRELAKFLRKFGATVEKAVHNLPITL